MNTPTYVVTRLQVRWIDDENTYICDNQAEGKVGWL